MTSELEEVKIKLCSYCAYQERSSTEVVRKMQEFDLSENEREDMTSFLVNEGYLDDKRFATTFAGSKFRQKKWGKQKIMIGLIQKGIDRCLCEQVLTEISDEEYYSAMLSLLEKKAALLDEPDIYRFRLKLYNFVKSKGYENEMIWRGIREIE